MIVMQNRSNCEGCDEKEGRNQNSGTTTIPAPSALPEMGAAPSSTQMVFNTAGSGASVFAKSVIQFDIPIGTGFFISDIRSWQRV